MCWSFSRYPIRLRRLLVRRWQIEIPERFFESAKNAGLSVVYSTTRSWVIWISDTPLWESDSRQIKVLPFNRAMSGDYSDGRVTNFRENLYPLAVDRWELQVPSAGSVRVTMETEEGNVMLMAMLGNGRVIAENRRGWGTDTEVEMEFEVFAAGPVYILACHGIPDGVAPYSITANMVSVSNP